MSLKSLFWAFTFLLLVVGIGNSFATWDGKSLEKPSIDTLDKVEYFIIENEAQLAWFADSTIRYTQERISAALEKAPNSDPQISVNMNAKIVAEFLDMGGHSFIPICAGRGNSLYRGIFDGNNVVISNLHINSDSVIARTDYYGQNIGLFGSIDGGTVQNVILDNILIEAYGNIGQFIKTGSNPVSIGAIAGWIKSGNIKDCTSSGTILTSGKGQRVGGIVGNVSSGNLNNILSSVSIYANGEDNVYIGGIAGGLGTSQGTKVTLTHCAYDGETLYNTLENSSGGIFGQNNSPEAIIEKNFYDSDAFDSNATAGISNVDVNIGVTKVKNLNTAKVVCGLNDGEWSGEDCSTDGAWSVGETRITLNGISKNTRGEILVEISFDANGGIFPEESRTSKFLSLGEKITTDEISTPIRGDTIFGGWAFTSDAEEPVLNFGIASGSKTLYAYWKKMIEITFDAGDGSFPDSKKNKTKYVGEDEIIDTRGIDIPTTYKEGDDEYYFVGWSLTKEGDVLDSLGTASEKTTFYAVWSLVPTYSVQFVANTIQASFVKENEKVNKPKDPELKGYTFLDWFTSETYETEFDFESPITENVLLYGKFEPKKYEITYNLNGGNNNEKNPANYTIESQTIHLENPSYTGHNFEGWYYDENYTQRATQILQGSYGDKTLYAKWSVKTYTIVYLAGTYGTEIVPSVTKKYGESITLREASYTREGYIQTGWTIRNNGAKNYKLGATYSKNTSITLYPYWEAVSTAKLNKIQLASSLKVQVQNRSILISGKENSKWYLHNLNGVLIQKGNLHKGFENIQVSKAGIYIVRCQNSSLLVHIK